MATSKALNAHAAFAGNYYGSVVIGQQINRNDDDNLFWKWLSPINSEEKHEDLLNKRTANTTTWILNHELFLGWIEGKEVDLWLKGPMGCGKSTLASTVVETLKEDSEAAIAYFYCDFTDKETLDPLYILRSILKQLILTQRENSSTKELISDLAYTYYNCHRQLTWPDIKKFILKMTGLPTKTFLVLDGIDECDEESQHKLIKYLIEIQKASVCPFKLFISGRQLRDVEDLLPGIQDIPLDEEVNLNYVIKDIQRHISSALKDVKFSPTFKDMISKKILSHEPHFRLVDCQMRLITDCLTDGDVNKALDELPMEMYEEYERVLRVIKNYKNLGHAKYVKNMLLWLVSAIRPLDQSELIEAICLDADSTTLFDAKAIINSERLVKLCGSFVTMKSSGKIALAHLTVKQFFMSPRLQQSIHSDFYMPLLESQRKLSILSMRYLLCHHFDKLPQEPPLSCKERPLLSYCALHWTTHVRSFMDEAEESLAEIARENHPPQGVVWRVIRSLWGDPDSIILEQRDFICQIALKILSQSSNLRANFYWVRHYLMALDNMSPFDHYYPDLSAIFYPVYTGNMVLTQRLLHQNRELIHTKMPQVGTALTVAVERNDTAMIAILVDDFNADINEACELRQWVSVAPLHLAVSLGHQEAFEALLKRGASTKSPATVRGSSEPEKTSILNTAIRHNRQHMFEVLCQLPGTDIDEQDHKGWTVWFHAIKAKSTEGIRFLINKGCNMTIVANDGKTGLEVALDMKDQGLVRHIVNCIVDAGASFPLSLDKLGEEWAGRMMTWIPNLSQLPGFQLFSGYKVSRFRHFVGNTIGSVVPDTITEQYNGATNDAN